MLFRSLGSWFAAAALAVSALPVWADNTLPPTALQLAVNTHQDSAPNLYSHAALVISGLTGETLYQKNAQAVTPIASITKLMTAMVTLDAGLPLDQAITVTDAEIDRLKGTGSRLAVGTTLSRREMLLLALMSSENRAAASLARTYPGGTAAFIAQMNRKARQIGMQNARFYDATGLNSGNQATALDLARMVHAASQYGLIRQFSTTASHDVWVSDTRQLHYKNSNALVREGEWQIGLSKTGYIQEAGRCLVMQATVGSTPLIIVLLAANATAARIEDAKQLRSWLEDLPQTWLAG